MKPFLTTLSLLAVLFSSEATAKTTLFDFGGIQNSFVSPWNNSSGTNPTLSTDRTTTGVINDTTGTASGVSVRYHAGTPLLISAPSSNTHLTGLSAQDAFGTNGLALWKKAHGVDLTTNRITYGWSEASLLEVGSLVDPGSIDVGGFQKNSSYTVSAVFTVSGLADIVSLTSAPVTLEGSNFNLSHAYISGYGGAVVDLLKVSQFELASLVSKGTFMMTWQLATNNAFNTSSTLNMKFTSDLLDLGGQYGISALAVTDGTPDLSIPEPSGILLGAFGLTALMLRRRK